MNITGETKFFIGVVAVSILILIAGVFMFSKPEKALPREQLVTAQAQVKGVSDAKTYLVEFSDFQCPACLAAKPYVDQLIQKYPDKLLFVYRHFPLDQHPYGEKAAEAAEAAGEQGKFWEMYELLFSDQANLSDEKVMEYAQKIGLDIDKFKESFTLGKLKDKVAIDRAYGTSIGVNSTPTFFLNGKKLILNQYSDLVSEVEKAFNQ